MENLKENTIKSPLKLHWCDITHQYKVSKPNIETGEYVDKKIAEELLEALIAISEELPKPSLAVTKIIKEIAENAIKKANI